MHDQHDVHLLLPADGAFVAVLRTTMAGLAARQDFTLDDIEDLRIAVGEACALVLGQAREGGDLICDVDLGRGEMTLHVAAPTDGGADPDHGSFAWQVLTALTTSVSSTVEADLVRITFTMHSTAVE